jgi:hypothetical protein
MRSSIYQKHAQEHYMASDATCFRIMDFNGSERSNLGPLNIEKTTLGNQQKHSLYI